MSEEKYPAPDHEVRPGGYGMWAPMIPLTREPEEWVSWAGDLDDGLEPVVVRSVD
jgi:hypothetical protein